MSRGVYYRSGRKQQFQSGLEHPLKILVLRGKLEYHTLTQCHVSRYGPPALHV